MIDPDKLAALMDHTNLKSYATANEIDLLCREAKQHKFATVCVYGYWVDYIAENHPEVKICQVLNFPSGLSLSNVETLSQVKSNASEYDIVMNISKLKEKQFSLIREDLEVVRAYTKGKVLKVIVESGVLTNEELMEACDIVAGIGADFVKTSTGFIPQPDSALIQQVAVIHNIIKLHNLPLEIKASGGIKTLDQVKILLGLGVTRFGSSNSVHILWELEDSGRKS